jgi:hypothetical protein
MKIYKTDGTIETVVLGKRKVTLDELQKAVGGWIEAVPGTRARAYCNEEGRLRGLPLNQVASQRFGQVLVGDVVELEKGDRQ